MKILKTIQGLYELYLWDENNEIPRGIQTSCVVLTEKEMKELRELLSDFEE